MESREHLLQRPADWILGMEDVLAPLERLDRGVHGAHVLGTEERQREANSALLPVRSRARRIQKANLPPRSPLLGAADELRPLLMRLMTMLFSKPSRPSWRARKISAMPPTAMRSMSVYLP